MDVWPVAVIVLTIGHPMVFVVSWTQTANQALQHCKINMHARMLDDQREQHTQAHMNQDQCQE
jgi:hypothetical protein